MKWALRIGWLVGALVVVTLIIIRQDPSTAAWIAFASNRTGSYQIYTMRPDGSAVRQLTDTETLNTFPDWSPDGRWIIFSGTSNLYSGTSEIYRVKRDGTELERLTYLGRTLLQPMYSPDGSQISFEMQDTNGSRLYLIDVDGKNLRQIPGEDIRSPAWSPDGEWIAFISGRGSELSIYKIHTTSLETKQLTSGIAVECCLRWEKDWIFVTDPNHSILRMRDDDTEVNEAISMSQFVCCPTISPDHQTIVFTAQIRRNLEIMQADWTGNHRTNLSQTSYRLDCCASWSPTFERDWRPDLWGVLIIFQVMICVALQLSSRVQ